MLQLVIEAGPGAQRTYGTYRQRVATIWTDRPLDTITASDIEAIQHQMAATALSAMTRQPHPLGGHTDLAHP